jgi:hypothetical protein
VFRLVVGGGGRCYLEDFPPLAMGEGGLEVMSVGEREVAGRAEGGPGKKGQ